MILGGLLAVVGWGGAAWLMFTPLPPVWLVAACILIGFAGLAMLIERGGVDVLGD